LLFFICRILILSISSPTLTGIVTIIKIKPPPELSDEGYLEVKGI
jgi:hypothetical protein